MVDVLKLATKKALRWAVGQTSVGIFSWLLSDAVDDAVTQNRILVADIDV